MLLEDSFPPPSDLACCGGGVRGLKRKVTFCSLWVILIFPAGKHLINGHWDFCFFLIFFLNSKTAEEWVGGIRLMVDGRHDGELQEGPCRHWNWNFAVTRFCPERMEETREEREAVVSGINVPGIYFHVQTLHSWLRASRLNDLWVVHAVWHGMPLKRKAQLCD